MFHQLQRFTVLMKYMVGAFKRKETTHENVSQNAVGNAIYSVVRYRPHDLLQALVFPAVKDPLRGINTTPNLTRAAQ